MKLNKKSKGKVYPSPSSSSSSLSLYSTTNEDASSVLTLLPAAILTFISVLSLEDREVLAYMITRSIEPTANPSQLLDDSISRRRRSKWQEAAHSPPFFDCGCFDCYTSYWFRWDSSPNRELIHQAIEAFEDHLARGEQWRKSRRGKRKEKIGRPSGSPAELVREEVVDERGLSSTAPQLIESPFPAVELPENVDFRAEEPVGKMDRGDVMAAEKEKLVEVQEDEASAETAVDLSEEEEDETVVRRTAASGGNHKGLARKVLPDVIGLFNSRLWSLWSPNV